MTQPNFSCPSLSKFVAYQLARESARLVALATASWRNCGDLADQARSAANSVCLNLSEGNVHPIGSPNRRRFQRYACGSAAEVMTALDLAVNNGVASAASVAEAATMARRTLGICINLTRPK